MIMKKLIQLLLVLTLTLGMFAGIAQWWLVLIYGFCIGLAANGFFDIALIQALLRAIGLEPKSKY